MTSINLQNLAKIGQLDPVPLSADLVQRMLTTAKRRLRDAELTQNRQTPPGMRRHYMPSSP